MARRVARGDVYAYAFRAPDKERPVVVISREAVIDLLETVMVAPITSTVRGIPSEVLVGHAEGLDHECAVNLDHIQTVAKARLGRKLGHLGADRMGELCLGIAVAVGCGDGE